MHRAGNATQIKKLEAGPRDVGQITRRLQFYDHPPRDHLILYAGTHGGAEEFATCGRQLHGGAGGSDPRRRARRSSQRPCGSRQLQSILVPRWVACGGREPTRPALSTMESLTTSGDQERVRGKCCLASLATRRLSHLAPTHNIPN